MLYASFFPKWARPTFDYEGWKSSNSPDTRRREFTAGSAKLALDVNYGGSSSSTQGAITDIGQFPTWATQVYGNATHGITQGGPIAAMWPDTDYYLPHESGYASQIVTTP